MGENSHKGTLSYFSRSEVSSCYVIHGKLLIKYTFYIHPHLPRLKSVCSRHERKKKGKKTQILGCLVGVLHSEMVPDLLKVRPTMNHRSLLTLEVSGVPYVLLRGDHIQTGCSRQWVVVVEGWGWGHSHCPSTAVTPFVLFLHLPVTNFCRNYFSFVPSFILLNQTPLSISSFVPSSCFHGYLSLCSVHYLSLPPFFPSLSLSLTLFLSFSFCFHLCLPSSCFIPHPPHSGFYLSSLSSVFHLSLPFKPAIPSCWFWFLLIEEE